jgi:hypothetical protein
MTINNLFVHSTLRLALDASNEAQNFTQQNTVLQSTILQPQTS